MKGTSRESGKSNPGEVGILVEVPVIRRSGFDYKGLMATATCGANKGPCQIIDEILAATIQAGRFF